MKYSIYHITQTSFLLPCPHPAVRLLWGTLACKPTVAWFNLTEVGHRRDLPVIVSNALFYDKNCKSCLYAHTTRNPKERWSIYKSGYLASAGEYLLSTSHLYSTGLQDAFSVALVGRKPTTQQIAIRRLGYIVVTQDATERFKP